MACGVIPQVKRWHRLRHAVENVAPTSARRPGAVRRLVGRDSTRGPRALDARFGPYTCAPPKRHFLGSDDLGWIGADCKGGRGLSQHIQKSFCCSGEYAHVREVSPVPQTPEDTGGLGRRIRVQQVRHEQNGNRLQLNDFVPPSKEPCSSSGFVKRANAVLIATRRRLSRCHAHVRAPLTDDDDNERRTIQAGCQSRSFIAARSTPSLRWADTGTVAWPRWRGGVWPVAVHTPGGRRVVLSEVRAL